MSDFNSKALPEQNDDDFLIKPSAGDGVFVNPAGGTYQAVIVDIVNLGVVKATNPQFKDEHKIKIVYQLEERITKDQVVSAYAAAGKNPSEDQFKIVGTRFVSSESFPFKFGPKANLRKRVQPIINRELTEAEEENGFKLTDLLGLNVQVTITLTPYKSDPKKFFPKVGNVIAWPEKLRKVFPDITVEDYVRVKDRPKTDAARA